VFDPITEAQGSPWSLNKWTTHTLRGSGSFVLDGGAREIRTSGAGQYADGLLAVSAHPAVGSFTVKAPLRFDTAGEKYAKLHFWGDGTPSTTTSNGRMRSSFWIELSNNNISLRSSLSPQTRLGSAITNVSTNNTAPTVEIEADAATGRIKVWVYTGTTRPNRPGIDVTAPAGTPRSGTFGAGFEGGAFASVQQFALLPMTVNALSVPTPAPTPTPTPAPTPAPVPNVFDPITEAAGTSWSASRWTTRSLRGSGSFVLDQGAREMRTSGAGDYADGLLA
jgi:hypothetical protein